MRKIFLVILISNFSILSFGQKSGSKDFEKWLKYYDLKQKKFKVVSERKECFNCKPEKENNIYYKEFNPKNVVDSLCDFNFSPNKNRSISLGLKLNYKNGRKYFDGWDDNQEIYLTDLNLKHYNLILWLGSSQVAEDSFWIDENTFWIVGFDVISKKSHFIFKYDIEKQTIIKLEAKAEGKKLNYFTQVYLKKKGIEIE